MKRMLALALLLCVFLCGCAGTEAEETPTQAVDALPTVTPIPVETPEPEPEWVPGNNPLTGLEMEEDYVNQRPVAVVLNNLKAAMPMYGVSQADIMVEALAEGGITRMIGLFQDPRQVPHLGSVRSARDYFLDVAGGFDALLVHAGGSPRAYELIYSRGIDAWDGVNGTQSESDIYYRDPERKKNAGYEHSLFTTGENITALWEKTSDRTTHPEGYSNGLSFVEDGTPVGGKTARTLTLPYSNYKTGVFTYNSDTGLYEVSQHDEPFVDGENGEQLAVTNVIILVTKTGAISGDEKNRISVQMTGEGEGIFACGGKYVPIRWSKDAWDANFEFTLEDGTPLAFGCGKSFINIFPSSQEYTIE